MIVITAAAIGLVMMAVIIIINVFVKRKNLVHRNYSKHVHSSSGGGGGGDASSSSNVMVVTATVYLIPVATACGEFELSRFKSGAG